MFNELSYILVHTATGMRLYWTTVDINVENGVDSESVEYGCWGFNPQDSHTFSTVKAAWDFALTLPTQSAGPPLADFIVIPYI